MITKGMKAPDFKLKNVDGTLIALSGFRGKKVVLYFYPKDDTPGCTTEACAFRDVYDDILALGAVVIGISPDGETSHEAFRKKFNLPFYLLADPEKTAIMSYGAWGEKSMYGKTYDGVLRTTFIIDKEGVVSRVFEKVTPKNHAEEVLAELSGK